MKSITRDYLAEIIFRCISKSIHIHRQSRNLHIQDEPPVATDEEIVEFIHAIPYFDNRLKYFILGQLSERIIIISQSWENEFILKCNAWVGSFEWLYGDDRFLKDAHLEHIRRSTEFLSLPY